MKDKSVKEKNSENEFQERINVSFKMKKRIKNMG